VKILNPYVFIWIHVGIHLFTDMSVFFWGETTKEGVGAYFS